MSATTKPQLASIHGAARHFWLKIVIPLARIVGLGVSTTVLFYVLILFARLVMTGAEDQRRGYLSWLMGTEALFLFFVSTVIDAWAAWRNPRSPNDLDALITLLGGRRRILGAAHPDRCETEEQKLAATVAFQELANLLKRNGAA